VIAPAADATYTRTDASAKKVVMAIMEAFVLSRIFLFLLDFSAEQLSYGENLRFAIVDDYGQLYVSNN